jgi:hypothetical protein
MRNETEQMQRVGVIRLRRDNLQVERLSLSQPPGVVMLEGRLKCLRNRHKSMGAADSLQHDARHIASASVSRPAW